LKQKSVKKKKLKPMNIIAPLILLVILYAGLELIIRVANISRFVLPTPSAVVAHTVSSFIDDVLPHFLFTLKVVVVGFIVAIPLGILIAAVFSQFNILVKAISPYIILLVVTPMITLIPLMMLWLGFDPNLRIIVVVVQATPIITLNTLSGFTNVETSKMELAKSIGASRFQTFTKIIFPNSMPQVFTGIKLGCIFSTIGAISADFVAGTVGLGFRIVQYTKYVMTEMVYGCILIVAIIGIALYLCVNFIERRVIVWKK